MQDSTILLGPGKADLLEAIDEHGSIRDAAASLDMSYMRAWKLIGVMNEGFREPLVVLHRGGSARGGAELTKTGQAVLRLYRQLERDTVRGTKRSFNALTKLLRRVT